MSKIASSMELTAGGLPSRIAARVIHVLLVGAIGAALGKQIGFDFDWLTTTAVVVILYFALMDAWVGATLGKLAVGLRDRPDSRCTIGATGIQARGLRGAGSDSVRRSNARNRGLGLDCRQFHEEPAPTRQR